MTRYFLSTDDDGPNVLFSGSKAEMVHFVTSQFLSGADTRPRSRSLPFRRGDGEQGVEPGSRLPAPPASERRFPPTPESQALALSILDATLASAQTTQVHDALLEARRSVSLADHIENGAWPVCDMDGWEGTE